jgi:hypothetical protein
MLIAVYIFIALFFAIVMATLLWPHRIDAIAVQDSWSGSWSVFPIKIEVTGKRIYPQLLKLSLFSKTIYKKSLNEVETIDKNREEQSTKIDEPDKKRNVGEKQKTEVVKPVQPISKSENSKIIAEVTTDKEDAPDSKEFNETLDEDDRVENSEIGKLSFWKKLTESWSELKLFWAREKRFVKKMWSWIQKAAKESSMMVMPTKVYCNFSGGHENVAETGKLVAWIMSFNIFLGRHSPFGVRYSPNFKQAENWKFESGVIWKFTFLKFLITGVHLLFSFPIIETFKIWRRFRRDKFWGKLIELWEI